MGNTICLTTNEVTSLYLLHRFVTRNHFQLKTFEKNHEMLQIFVISNKNKLISANAKTGLKSFLPSKATIKIIFELRCNDA